jgi:galactokinase
MSLRDQIIGEFSRRFGAAPQHVTRAPGRVNLIGEHTDYNDGFVLPMAIDRAVWIALRAREDERVRVHSLEYNAAADFSLAGFANENQPWAEHIKGVAWALQQAGHKLRGWEGVRTCDVPIGAGLSSSAALEMAAARAFAAVSGIEWDPLKMARIGQLAENKWVGVNCGIMDQTISAAGVAGHALWIDCRTLVARAVPMPAGTVVVVLDTGTRRGLVDSAYNQRRKQCEAAAQFFGVASLRDVTVAMLAAHQQAMDDLTRRRARHVVTENARTIEAAEAMRDGDARRLGELMNDSHESLRTDFEVSSRELDAMVECARATPGCLGARMTGAGFGGCAVALVTEPDAESFAASVGHRYRDATGREPLIYICHAANGAELLPAGPPADARLVGGA